MEMKRFFSVSAALLLLLLLLPAFSAGAENSSQLPYYVSDTAGLMTADEWQKLEDRARQISEQYGCGVYVVTLNDYTEYGSYSSFWDFSTQFYTGYQMGIGSERNGILLILSMKERDYSLLAYGSDAHYAFTDYGKEVLENSFLDNFRRNDWTGGFSDYIDGCGNLLSRAAAGSPLDVSYDRRDDSSSTVNTAIVICFPLLISFAVCQGMKRKMKPVREQSRANDYIVPGGVRLTVNRDVFVNRTVSRTVIRSEQRDSHSSGGGTTIHSSGFSGHSGKF